MILISLLSILYFVKKEEKINNTALINEIKNAYENKSNINLDGLNLKRKIDIENSDKFNVPEEYLALGYSLLYNNDENAFIREIRFLLIHILSM